METAIEIDVRGSNCPTPYLRMIGAFKQLAKDQILKVVATDLGTKWSFSVWAKRTGNKILKVDQNRETIIWFIQKTN